MNKPYQAAAELDQSCVIGFDGNAIDTYITCFAELVHKVLYHENDSVVLEKFKVGLLLELLKNCMHHDEPHNWDA